MRGMSRYLLWHGEREDFSVVNAWIVEAESAREAVRTRWLPERMHNSEAAPRRWHVTRLHDDEVFDLHTKHRMTREPSLVSEFTRLEIREVFDGAR
jgi:hypothetical protein